MPPRQKSLTRGRWRAFALSLLLHSAIVAGAVLAWKYWKRTPPPVETVAIQGTLVDEKALDSAPLTPAPAPEPVPPPPEPEPLPMPEPEEQGPPKPDPAEIERRQEEERQKQEELEQQQKADQEKAAREEAEKVAAAKAAAEKAAAQKAAEEKKRIEAEKKKRADEEAAAKKAAEEKARQAREAELRRSLEAEERARALRNSDAAARWHAQIVARIQRAWIQPPSAQPGISCTVLVTQVPGGEVTSVRVDSCSGGDAAFRESVEAAVYRASPLPTPPDPALFERNLELTFAPTS